jgi:hypothetical protein
MRGITLTAAMVVLTMSSSANAGLFGLFGSNGYGGGCSAEPTCCAPVEASCCAPAACCEPTCCAPAACCNADPTCCAPAPASCCDEGCGCSVKKKGCGLFSKIKNMFKRNKGCGGGCCEPTCCAPAEPTCCAPAEPTCCAPVDPNCCAPAGCN